MPQPIEFRGFPKECMTFLKDLKANNTTSWFNQHKGDYEQYVLDPARAFIYDMGERLHAITPDIIADPRVNRSLFRINRDTRFSKDKTPYKTHLAIWFWEGAGPRMECSGYYFHLEPDRLMLGVGIYCFPKPLLDRYREYVVHKTHGPALAKAIQKVTEASEYTLGGEHFKRVPRGYDADHKYAALLRHNGLYAGIDMAVPDELFSEELLDYCFDKFYQMKPLHEWLVGLTEG
ncbi:MAG: DUF2461 domain-containing protein [Candidatus Latescibacteria bacterium]|nr:DUF2461 domain-containing protein [Candidatus Latescibacterota bacterium]